MRRYSVKARTTMAMPVIVDSTGKTAPVEARSWSGVLEAREFGAMCYQPLENDVWDTVESSLDLGHLEAQLRKALAAELGSDLYEEEVEELEDELRKVAEARESEERAWKARLEGDCDKDNEVDGRTSPLGCQAKEELVVDLQT
ncbi:uncharacterized protein LOC119590334, partial [Penaeus monodon]|uniref:uncharacterized protein LOC119590334 n=1 Tax=Penaeus monodon TaxID=6687 RepID=UPI0018A7C8F6